MVDSVDQTNFDQLKIDTPEQIALELPLAGIGSRFLAMVIDTLIQAALFFLIAIIFIIAGLSSSFYSFSPGIVGQAIAIFVGFAIYWGYFAIFETFWKGQTPGKRFAGIRVIKESGRPINAFEAIGRNFMRAVDGMPGIYGVGLLTMMLNRQSRRLGDFVAGTVVVHEKPTEEVRPVWNTATEAPTEVAVSTGGLGQVTADELVLIETYLSRRFDLDPEVRLRTAIQIADRIKAKTNLQPLSHQHVDDFLEEAARKIRDSGRFR
jgi:uncharacterized RDD family membrane protein YckC